MATGCYHSPGPRTADRFGNIPVRGAIADYMRLNGRSRPTVLADLRAGRLCVNADGKIAPTPGTEVVPPRREAGRRCVLPLTAGANHGALLRARRRYGLGVRPFYLRLERGEFVIGDDGEFVRAPVLPTAPIAPPQVRDRRAAILADVEKYLDDLSAVDPTAGQDFAHAVVNKVQVILASRRTAP